MTMMFATRILWVLTVVAPVVLAPQPTRADVQGQAAAARRADLPGAAGEMNAWTVGLAAGRIEGVVSSCR